MTTTRIFATRIIISAVFLVSLSIPAAFAHANVLINEIAWMGTTTSSNAEWMELYNSSPESVSLDGWSLAATDGSPSIQLSGSIAGSGYYMLERTSNATLPSIPANLIYTGDLSNTGEHLQLKDNLGNVVDDVDASAGWPAGDNTSKETMQRSGSSWITGAPTPDAPNVTVDDKPSGTSGSATSSSTAVTPSGGTDDASALAVKEGTRRLMTTLRPFSRILPIRHGW